MLANEVRPCDLCEQPLLRGGLKSFYRIRFEQLGVDGRHVSHDTIEAVKLIDPEYEVAHLIREPADLIVCLHCGRGGHHAIVTLLETAARKLRDRLPDPPAHHVPKEQR